jgi:drug/metabolite transporter (DMT)-like permease
MLFLMSGIFWAALFVDAFSVYLLRDVDHDQIGHLNAAFAGLCAESIIFALLIGGSVGLFTSVGKRLLHLRGYSPREMLSLFLGVGVTVFQYIWDYIARRAFPKSAGLSLYLYLVIAVVVCTVVLLRNIFRQMKFCGAAQASSSA